jgi:hypothetical protein
MKKKSYLLVKLKARMVKKSLQSSLNMTKVTREKMLERKTEMLGKMRKAFPANLSKRLNSSPKIRLKVSSLNLHDKKCTDISLDSNVEGRKVHPSPTCSSEGTSLIATELETVTEALKGTTLNIPSPEEVSYDRTKWQGRRRLDNSYFLVFKMKQINYTLHFQTSDCAEGKKKKNRRSRRKGKKTIDSTDGPANDDAISDPKSQNSFMGPVESPVRNHLPSFNYFMTEINSYISSGFL